MSLESLIKPPPSPDTVNLVNQYFPRGTTIPITQIDKLASVINNSVSFETTTGRQVAISVGFCGPFSPLVIHQVPVGQHFDGNLTVRNFRQPDQTIPFRLITPDPDTLKAFEAKWFELFEFLMYRAQYLSGNKHCLPHQDWLTLTTQITEFIAQAQTGKPVITIRETDRDSLERLNIQPLPPIASQIFKQVAHRLIGWL